MNEASINYYALLIMRAFKNMCFFVVGSRRITDCPLIVRGRYVRGSTALTVNSLFVFHFLLLTVVFIGVK